MSSNNVRKLVFALITLLCGVVAVLYTLLVARPTNVPVSGFAAAPTGQSPAALSSAGPSGNPSTSVQRELPQGPLASPSSSPSDGNASLSHGAGQGPAQPYLVALNLRDQADLGKVALSALDEVDAPRASTNLRCERIHFAKGTGICLTREVEGLVPRTVATLVDARFQPLSSVRIDGIPTRARISPDGRYAAFTVFVTGHSYADDQLSTATLLLDVATGTNVGNLEEFRVLKDGNVIRSLDFNYWGVTFQRDSNFFYATLQTAGVNYLVRGDVKAKTVIVTYAGVECPSLSPDETRIAFKKRISRANWRLTVLDLATLKETPLAEPQSVDDQAEWLDNDRVLYALPDPAAPPPGISVMVVSAGGAGQPKVFARGAGSPAVVR